MACPPKHSGSTPGSDGLHLALCLANLRGKAVPPETPTPVQSLPWLGTPHPAPCSASRHGPGSQLYIIQYGYSSPLGKGPRSGHGTLNPPVTLGAASLPPIHGSRGCPSVLSLPAPGSPQGLLGGHRIHALLGPGGGRVSTHLRPSPGPYLVTHSVTQLDQPRAATASGLIWPPGRAAPSWSSTLPPAPGTPACPPAASLPDLFFQAKFEDN